MSITNFYDVIVSSMEDYSINPGQSCIRHVTYIHILDNYITNYTAKLRKFQKRNAMKLERMAADWKLFGLLEKK